jgi:hypothetical protein
MAVDLDPAIVAGEPCLVTRSPLIPRGVLCNCTLRPLLSRLKSSEDFVAFVAEPCVAAPGTLEVVLVTGSWPRCVFEEDSEDAGKVTLRTIRPDIMLVERELYLKLAVKSCIFGDFIDSLLLYNRDREKICRLLSNVRTCIKDRNSYGLFFMTEVRGMEDFMDQTASIFDIVVNAGVETSPEGSRISLRVAKHPDISQVGKRIEVDLGEGGNTRV